MSSGSAPKGNEIPAAVPASESDLSALAARVRVLELALADRLHNRDLVRMIISGALYFVSVAAPIGGLILTFCNARVALGDSAAMAEGASSLKLWILLGAPLLASMILPTMFLSAASKLQIAGRTLDVIETERSKRPPPRQAPLINFGGRLPNVSVAAPNGKPVVALDSGAEPEA